MVWRRTQSPIGKYVPDVDNGVSREERGGSGAPRGCGAVDVQGYGGQGSGRLGAREPACRVRAGRQPLSERRPLRDSGHAVDTGGAVCATVVGIARNQGGSAWSP